MKWPAVLKFLALAVIGGLLFWMVRSGYLPLDAWMKQFVAWVGAAGFWGPAVLAMAYIPATVLFIPGSLLTLGAGVAFGPVIGTLAVSAGSTLGSLAAFLIGRFLARDWVTRKVESNPRFRAIDEAVALNGFRIVLLTRLSPVFPYNLLGYMYGITQVRTRDYLLASWLGMLPGTAMYVYLGSVIGFAATGGDRARTPLEWSLYGLGLGATVFVTIYVTRVARRAMKDAVPLTEAVSQDRGLPSLPSTHTPTSRAPHE